MRGEAIENYLKSIYQLSRAGGEAGGGQATAERVGTLELAHRLGVTAASASRMMQRRASLGLVEHERYRGATLTEPGRRVALEVIRHHRLIEQYLVETLGLPLDAVHAEADRLEHALSEELEAHIDRSLGFPTSDPHGDPIPGPDLRIAPSSATPLSALEPGARGTVSRVPDGDGEVLRYLAKLKLTPGNELEVRESAPFDGPLTVRVAGADHAISRELAAQISVS